MKILKYILFLILPITLLYGTECHPLATFKKINSKELYFKEQNIKIKLKTMKTIFDNSANLEWWGTENTTPTKVISSVIVEENKNKIVFPVSAYIDLTELWGVKVIKVSKGFKIVFIGSQTDFLYQATFLIHNNQLVERKVISCTFPEERWEKTTYSWIQDTGQ
ncbi:hypothetical protein [Sulfurimonas sp. HSL-1716]|uniref:hypothetical protein n=1 Tax=Hydrocurvibacter sulfurireducens TaxID=3131937 RepID=UPI0031FA350D